MTPAAVPIVAMSGARHLWEAGVAGLEVAANRGNSPVPGYGDESVTQ
jgi:hypothetical protein